jgi:uncharacterized metal-binding protein YceD (DUF177 family)
LILPISPLETGRSPLEMSIDLNRLELGEWVRPLEPMELEGSVDKFGEAVTVRGHGEARVEETCARCTGTFERTLAIDILVYCDRRGSDAEADTRQLEQEGEVVYHDGVSVDLTEPVREAVILAQPMNPLCRRIAVGCAPVAAPTSTSSPAGAGDGRPTRAGPHSADSNPANDRRRAGAARNDRRLPGQLVQDARREPTMHCRNAGTPTRGEPSADPLEAEGHQPVHLFALHPAEAAAPGVPQLRLLRRRRGHYPQGIVNTRRPITVGVDGMGGDEGPGVIVEGALLALREMDADGRVALIGDQRVLEAECAASIHPVRPVRDS